MSINISKKRRTENNERVDDDDDDCIQNEDNYVNPGSDNDVNVRGSNGQSGIEYNQYNDNNNNVENTNDDDKEGNKDEEYDIHIDKKRKSENESMINYAEIFSELIHRNQSSFRILDFLEKHPIAVQQINSEGDYPLHVVCRYQYENIDRIILKLIDLYKIAVKKPDNDGYYPLHIACDGSLSEDVIMKLIEVFPEAVSIALDSPGDPPGSILPLHLVCLSIKSDTLIRKLIELDPKALQEKAGNNRYPFHYAVDGNQSSEVIEFIMNDSIIDFDELFEDFTTNDFRVFIEKYPIAAKKMDHAGEYLLHFACSAREFGVSLHVYNIIVNLIELNTLAVTKPDKDGYYPLHIACEYGQSDDVIAKLIEISPEAAANSLNQYGSSPLNLACRYIRSDTVIRSLIISNPKALQQKDSDGNYPIHSAIRGNQSNDIIQYILNIDPLSIQRQDGRARSPLHIKYQHGLCHILMESMVRYSNILVNMRDERGRTPLHIACHYFQDDMVEFLLQYSRIDINAKTYVDIASPLHLASSRSRISIVRKLLDHPCILINEKDINNKTPIDWIKEQIKRLENKQIIRLEDRDTEQNEYRINYIKRKISEYLEIKKLLEDFPVN